MGRYLALRTARALLTLFGVVTAVFCLVRVIPGDPALAILGDQASPEDRAALRTALHLDASLVEQYRGFLADILDGSLGTSFRQQGTSVSTLLFAELPHTIALAAASLGVALSMGILLGAAAAAFRGRWLDHGALGLAVLGLAVPTLCLGPLLILVFGLWLQWLPLPGGAGESGVFVALAELVLPALTVGTALSAVLLRQTRGALVEVLAAPYILAARSRGIGEARIVFRHALRNALFPVTTVAAAQFAALLSGTVITEKIFERDGLGTLFLSAFFSRDLPVVQGTVLLVAASYIAVNFVLDLAYCLIDPRVRLPS